MRFLLEEVEQIDRHTEIDRCDMSNSGVIHEEMTVRIKLISSDDTSQFTSGEILAIIMDRLKVISSK